MAGLIIVWREFFNNIFYQIVFYAEQKLTYIQLNFVNVSEYSVADKYIVENRNNTLHI